MEGTSRSFSRPSNVLPRGWRLLRELVPLFLPAGDESLDCRSFKRSSVSRSRASRAWSSLVCEFTASFLNIVSSIPKKISCSVIAGLLQLD